MKPAIAFVIIGTSAALLAPACGSHDSKKTDRSSDHAAGAGGESSLSPVGDAGQGGVAHEAGAPSQAGAPGGGDVSQGKSADEAPVSGAGQGGDNAPTGEGGAGGAAEPPVTCEPATTCTGDLSNVGLADFSIAFRLVTTSKMHSGILSQRTSCGRSKFWDVRLGTLANPAALTIEFDDGSANYTDVAAFAPFNDGNAHDVCICRKSGHVYAFSDGERLADAPNLTSFGALPALATKTTVCNATDGTVTLVGTVSNVCIGTL